MDHSPAEIVRKNLTDDDYGSTPSTKSTWPIFVGHMPDGDGVEDAALCIYDSAGVLERKMRGGVRTQHYGIQIRCRCGVYNSGWVKINEITEALDAVIGVSVAFDSATYYTIKNFTLTSAIVPLGADEAKGRFHWTVNFIVTLLKG